MRLSIVIPYYNTKKYTDDLLDVIDPQITDGVEVLLVDDGSTEKYKTKYSWCKVIRQKNSGSSGARNTGIENTTGDYISFIDSDDLISEKFIETVLERIKDGADVINLSWRTMSGGYQVDHRLRDRSDRLPNPSVCTRIFKRSAIGDNRFNTKKDSTEDEDFSRRLGYLNPKSDLKQDAITDYMYFYRSYSETSKTQRYAKGLTKTKRVYYYYEKITPDMTDLLEEIKKEDETNEVLVMSRSVDLDGLERYCQIKKPAPDWGHIVRGEPNNYLKLRKPAVKTQIVLYRRFIPKIGGLSTFIDNFLETMGDKYDITIAAEIINEERYIKWRKKARVIAYKIKNVMRSPMIRPLPEPQDTTREIYTDNLILLSFLDTLPSDIHAEKVIRMVHACKTSPEWKIPHDADEVIYVSNTAMKSYGESGKVIHNMNVTQKEKALLLVSATRLPAPDKGKLEERMLWLANELNNKGVNYIWLNFADGELSNPPRNFYNMGVRSDIQSVLKAADYLVQLSDSECWSYSCLEALTNGCACIVTPFPSAYEMGIEDGVNGYIIPFNLDFDVTRLKKVPKFKYPYDNNEILKEWVKILGDKPPRRDYKPPTDVATTVIRGYYDIELKKDLVRGDLVYMPIERAKELTKKRFVIMEGDNGEI